MTKIFDIINIPLSYVMRFLAQLFGGHFAASVFVFTLLIDVILIPLSIKSQKSSVEQLRIKPKLDELKKRYGDDKQKFAQEQQALYQKEGVSMAGGCVPMLVRLLLLFSIYSLILCPVTYMAGANKNDVSAVSKAVNTAMEDYKEKDEKKFKDYSEKLSWPSGGISDNNQLGLVKVVDADPTLIKEIVGDKNFEKIEKNLTNIKEDVKKADIDYTLFGIDLTDTPDFDIDIFHNFKLNWLLPIGSFIAQMLMSVISMRINKINNPDAPSMGMMLYLMPIVSLAIGFTFPCGVCFYWICSSVVGGLVQVLIQVIYGPQRMLVKVRAKALAEQCDFESKQLAKYDGTEKNDIF